MTTRPKRAFVKSAGCPACGAVLAVGSIGLLARSAFRHMRDGAGRMAPPFLAAYRIPACEGRHRCFPSAAERESPTSGTYGIVAGRL